ncbi:hypothetical protein KP509_38G064500 [Ceratopteris richardii]|uniref:Phosphatidic acid phosphatase type 2/haloperoxidase domain-containing protein n=1 Tax=Ceratopteris richardii TaxID=49495 RepID=A0A8T2Q5R4_CERRI|nr:hypothetical protein KP509_38G064500 [Ceratopteris richardii]
MRSRSTSMPSDHRQSPLPSSPGEDGHISLGSYLDSKSEQDNQQSMVDHGRIINDIEHEVILTLRGASYKLLRFHIHDWLAIIGLAILDGVLNLIEPFHRFVGEPMINDYMYPLKSNTIPFQTVPAIAIGIPLVVFIAYFLYTKDITDLHHAVLGVLFSVLITAVITDAIKDAVGRPRPDFFWRCFPDGVASYNNVTKEVICTGLHSVIKEGHKSFPSGHTSWSFAGLGFLSWYLAGKLELFNRRGHVAKLAVVFTPLLAALLVGLSRVDDYWHHWNDVFGGAIIGLLMSSLCYHHLFPSVLNENCVGPHNHLQIGKDFKLGFLSWLPLRRKRSDWPPERIDGVENRDMELGSNPML